VILFPAIDLKDGVCVRLVRGDMTTATVFNCDPAAQARQFADAGFSWLHVVDLDGAVAGRSLNGAAVAAIRSAVCLRMQLGGGIRNRAAIEHWLALGVDRVVLGTSALRDPELVREAAADHPGRIVIGSGLSYKLGIDANAVAAVARQIRVPVVVSGGVSSLDDIAALKAREADGIAGVICGRALYDGRIDPAAALHLLSEAPQC